MSPQKKKKLDAAIDNLFSSSRPVGINVSQSDPEPTGNGKEGSAAAPEQSIDASQPDEKNSDFENNQKDAVVPARAVELSNTTPLEKEQAPAAPIPETPLVASSNPDQPSTAALPGLSDVPLASTVQFSGETLQVVIFTLVDQYYAMRIDAVESIIKMQAITELPHVAPYVLGLTNLRGKVLPVLSLRLRFGLPDQEPTKDSRIIVIRADQVEAGLIVDGVTEVETLPQESIEPAPAMTTLEASNYVYGIAKLGDRLIILLDLVKVLSG